MPPVLMIDRAIIAKLYDAPSVIFSDIYRRFGLASDAVWMGSCDAELLGVLRGCGISRVLIKPFRVRDVIDTIGGMRERARSASA